MLACHGFTRQRPVDARHLTLASILRVSLQQTARQQRSLRVPPMALPYSNTAAGYYPDNHEGNKTNASDVPRKAFGGTPRGGAPRKNNITPRIPSRHWSASSSYVAPLQELKPALAESEPRSSGGSRPRRGVQSWKASTPKLVY